MLWIERGKLIEAFCVAVLMMTIFGVETANASFAPIEWTQNSTFVLSVYQWDPILYDWEWSVGDEPFWDGSETNEVFTYDAYNHAWWLEDGVVQLAATDAYALDFYGRSARITYGPFIDPYSDDVPPSLSVTSTNTLTLKGVVSNYGSANEDVLSWTGLKFDAWFKDPLEDNRKMVIEMYFHGTGVQGSWGSEEFRPLGPGGEADDYIIKLQAFPGYCTMTGDIPGSNFALAGVYSWDSTEFTIDLKGIWQRAADHFGRSSLDQLYAVALDVESGRVFNPNPHLPPTAFAEVNEIKVTYTPPPPPTHKLNVKAEALDDPSLKLDVNVWHKLPWQLGWDWVGVTPLTLELQEGYHDILVSEGWAPDPYLGWFYVFYDWKNIGLKGDRDITVSLFSDMTITARYANSTPGGGGGGGGGCLPWECHYEAWSPTLFVWNGSNYVKEAIFHLHGDSDITVWHDIEFLVPERGHYLLSLRELNQSVSYIDYVKLYAVDTNGNMYPIHLTHAVHNESGNVKQLLKFDDNQRVNLAPSQTIDLKFETPEIENIAYFIFEIQGYESH